MANPHGTPVWHELATRDPGAARVRAAMMTMVKIDVATINCVIAVEA